MKSNWPETDEIRSIRNFSAWLAYISVRQDCVYRGQSDPCWRLKTSLARSFLETDTFEQMRKKENEYMAQFRSEARRYLGKLEKDLLGNEDTTGSMTVMRHFGVPTRLLDWTSSGAIAAYFACIDHAALDGTVWWLNASGVVKWVDCRWDELGYKRKPYPNSQINLCDRIDEESAPKFVSMTHLLRPFSRADAQCGLFTFGSQPDLPHDVQLANQLKEESYGRVVISTNIKSEVIQLLESIGIDGISLQHTGADRVGLKMAWDREHEAGIEENKDLEDTTK